MMDGIISQLVTNPRVQNFSYIENPFDPSKLINLFNTRKELINYGFYNNFLLGYFIAFNKSRLVLGPGMTYTYKEFYDIVLRYEDKDFIQWQNDIALKYYKGYFMPAT